MNWETLFSIAGTAVLPAWAALIFLPRWLLLLNAIQYGLIGALCAAYAALILVFFFRVEGGGFGSIAQVRALFASDPVLLAGWLHYLAFDLFVGLWIVRKLDARAVSRLIQAPVLAATFLFGPLGLLLGYALMGAQAVFAKTSN
jgi:Domain of unknown function (DUF4281)